MSAFYLAAARSLTLARLVSIPLFLFLLVQTYRAGPQHWRMSLLLLYVCIALSDFLDGWLARKAGAPSHVWGQIDATADIAFTSLSLATAAWLGRVGPWVPAGVAVLGGRFLLRNLRHQPTLQGRLVEDRAGKTAGVIYYLLVGAVAIELSVAGEGGPLNWPPSAHTVAGNGRPLNWAPSADAVAGNGGRWFIARAGDAVFLYTLFLLVRRRKERPSPSGP